MSINNLNEQVNKRVVYDGDNHEVSLPYNISAICSLAPQWCKKKEIKDRVVQVFKERGVTYTLTDKKTNNTKILKDLSSKIPLNLSGNYTLYDPTGQSSQWPQSKSVKEFFSDKPELIEKLKITYSLKERLKYDMTYSETEMETFSEKNNFAKTIYRRLKGETVTTDTWETFEGRDDVEVIDEAWWGTSDLASGAMAVEIQDNGILLYVEDEYYKDKFLDVTDDDSWAYNSAMHGGYYNDCEEMDEEELNYMNSYLTPESIEKLQKLRELTGNRRWSEAEIERGEGETIEFLEEFFSEEAASFSNDWLTSLGCAIQRGREKGMSELIEDEKTFNYSEGKQGNTEMFISWAQLLQIVGQYNIENFVELEDHSLNGMPNLSDAWYDNWEVDKEGEDELNYDFNNLFTEIMDQGMDIIKNKKERRENFVKKLEELGFKKASGWNQHFRNTVYELEQTDGKSTILKHIKVGDYNAKENTVNFKDLTKQPKGKDFSNEGFQKDVQFDKFIEYVVNTQIPFPEEEDEKEVNENYTNKIINNIVNTVIQENTYKKF